MQIKLSLFFYPEGRRVMCLEGLVLFVHSVQHGCKFLLAARLIRPTTDRHTVQPEFPLPHQPGHSVVNASVTRCSMQPSVI